MNMNGAKHTRNVTRRLPFGDRNVTANTGAVFTAFGERRKGGGNKKCNGEEQSGHKKTSWASVRLEWIRRAAHSSELPSGTARNGM